MGLGVAGFLTAGMGGCIALSLTMCGQALAQAPESLATQEANTAAATAAATQVFDAAYLSQYTVNNAEDLLRRLPGVTTILDAGAGGGNANQRGLGAGSDQVLIDGKRLASKANNIGATLRRIPASSVDRVELIRGSSDEVQSEGLVVNVILKRGVQIGGVGNFEAVYRFSDMGYGEFDGLISYANTWGPISYVLGYERAAWSPVATSPGQGATDFSKRFRDEVYYYPSGAISELRPQKWRRVHQKDILTGSANYLFGDDESLRLNLLYQPNPVKQVDVTAITRFAPTGAPTTRATEQHYNKNRLDTFELGGEAEKVLGPGRLNVIALHSRRQNDLLDFRIRHEAAGPVVELGRSVNDQQTGEDAVQASYVLPVVGNQTLTLGVEGARNFLTQEIEVFADIDRDGRLEPVAVPTALARVREKRAELSLIHSWRISSDWTLDSALFFEISRINTNYPAIPVRTLKYLKPRFDLRYNLSRVDRLRFKVEKTMGQLDFANFVPAYNIVDSRIDLGNPLILPTKTWLFEVGYERRLPGDHGTLGLRAWHQLREGGVGFIPFGFTSTGLPQSARGNLPTVLLYASEVTASVRLTMLGLPGAQFNARAWQQHTRYTDPFSGVRWKAPTPFAYDIVLGFRHDVASWRASYGVDYLDTGGVNYISDVRVFEGYSRGKRFGVYAERALWGDYSIRVDAYNVNGAREQRYRRLYAIGQSEGTLSRTESIDELRDRRFAVRLRGKF